MSQKIIFVGNPGTGKSALLNSVIGKLQFESGVSFGCGKTQRVQFREQGGIEYGDTPGLSDVNMRKQAAEEIRKALQQDGNYKLVFVCTQEAGRVRPDDVTTMKLVLEAINDPKFPFGIVISKVSECIYSKLTTDSDTFKNFFAAISSYRATALIFIYPEDEQLKDADNVVAKPNAKFVKFLLQIPSKTIENHQVQQIRADDFDESNKELEMKIGQLQTDVKLRDAELARLIAELKQQTENNSSSLADTFGTALTEAFPQIVEWFKQLIGSENDGSDGD